MPRWERDGCEAGSLRASRSSPIRAPRTSTGSGKPASASRQRTIPLPSRRISARQIADAFGLFGSPERCADRLLRAREEAGVDDVFLFPAHDLAGGYNMPEAELAAFDQVIRQRLGGC